MTDKPTKWTENGEIGSRGDTIGCLERWRKTAEREDLAGFRVASKNRLVTCLLACSLSLGVVSFTPGQSPPPDAAEQPTYAGRGFEQWQRLATNDLDPETRLKGMLAIASLGRGAARPAAVQTLGRVLDTESEPVVRSAAYVALLTFGEAALPEIRSGLTAENDGERRIALYALADFFAPLSADAYRHGIVVLPSAAGLPANSRLPQAVIPLLAGVLENDRRRTRDRTTAVRALRGLYRRHPRSDGAERVVRAATDLAEDTDVTLACEAIRLLGQLGRHAEPAVDTLTALARRGDRPRPPQRTAGQPQQPPQLISRSMAAIEALGELGAVARDAIPLLERLADQTTGRTFYTAGLARRAAASIRNAVDRDAASDRPSTRSAGGGL